MGSAKVLRFPSPAPSRPRALTADLRATLGAMRLRTWEGACERCGLSSEEHGLLRRVECGRATNYETRR